MKKRQFYTIGLTIMAIGVVGVLLFLNTTLDSVLSFGRRPKPNQEHIDNLYTIKPVIRGASERTDSSIPTNAPPNTVTAANLELRAREASLAAQMIVESSLSANSPF